MPPDKLHDFSKDSIDVWYSRVVKLIRAGEFWLDIGRSAVFVLAGAIIGTIAGGIIGSKASKVWPGAFIAGLILGALLGGVAGGKVAKRVLFGDRVGRAAPEDTSCEEAVFAPHMPGVQEKFARARQREFALFLAIPPSAWFLVYLLKAGPEWPVPGFLPRGQLLWAALALFVALFALLVLNARCPACRRHIGSLIKLRRCPLCGVAFRD